MRAVICKALGEIDDLTVEDIPEPVLGDGMVRVSVTAAGVNFADTLLIAGRYQVKPALPFSPGFEVAGRVIDCGEGVTRCRPGDRVVAVPLYGGFSEQVVVREANVFVLPEGLSDKIAAAFPVVYGTAHLGLKFRAQLAAGEVLLVHGAAGGAGHAAVEIGKRLGATVIGTASGKEKCAIAAQAGADHTFDARSDDLVAEVKALTNGRGADVVYDPVGGQLFERSVRCTAAGGRMLIVGFASGDLPAIPPNYLLVKNIAVIGYHWGGYRSLAPDLFDASLRELITWLANGEIHLIVSQTYDLAEATTALKALRDRKTTGKIVLTIGS